MVVEAEEQWLDGDASTTAHAEERKAFLGRCFDVFGVVSEGPVEAGSPGAYGLTVRYENDDFQPVVQREVYLAQGPLLCSLRLSGPEGARDRERIFGEIARSFRLTSGQLLSRTETFQFFKEPGRVLVEASQGQRVAFPHLCASLMIPAGWKARSEGREKVLDGPQTEIRVRRLLGRAREPATWMGDRLQELRESGARLLGWSQGNAGRHGAFTALWIDGSSGAWRTAASRRTLRLRLGSGEPLEWTVQAALRRPEEVEEVLGQLIAGLEDLEPEQWLTLPIEPWIEATLEGPWTCKTPGLYIHPELYIPVLELREQDDAPLLESLRPSLFEALRNGAGVLPGSKQESEELGRFRGLNAWRYAGDGHLSVRGIWIEAGRKQYCCLLLMRDPKAADALFSQLLEGLRLPTAKR